MGTQTNKHRHRRTSILLITLIAGAVLIAATIQPLLLSFLVGTVTGFFVSLLAIIWLLKS